MATASYAGCSLDDRALTLDDGFSGSSNSPNASGAGNRAGASASGDGGSRSPTAGSDAVGQAGQAEQAGQGGEAGQGEGGAATFPDGCSDLDRNGISDCTESLLQNSAFTSDTTHWTSEIGATLSWDATDLLGDAGSGSALVTSSQVIDNPGDLVVSAFQCIPVHAGKLVSVWADAQIDSRAANGQAEISFWFFPNADCPGDSPSIAATPATEDQIGRVVTLKGRAPVPDDMVAMRLRLSVVKPFRTPSVSVRFDNVLVVER